MFNPPYLPSTELETKYRFEREDMTQEQIDLKHQLLTSAVLGTDHPVEAAAMLICTAGAILERDLGAFGAIGALQDILDEVSSSLAESARPSACL